MSADLVEIVRLMAKRIQGLEQRLAQTVIGGTVTEVKGDRVRLSLDIDGRDPVSSPLVRLGGASGYNGAGVSSYTRPGIGESMLLITPGGRVGEHSRAIPWGPVDDRPAPGSAEEDGEVRTIGQSQLRIRPSEILLRCGESYVRLTPTGIELHADQIQTIGGALTHNGANVGDSHIHGGVWSGPATTAPPVN